MYSHM
jgi:hypothetical protein